MKRNSFYEMDCHRISRQTEGHARAIMVELNKMNPNFERIEILASKIEESIAFVKNYARNVQNEI